jgi:hypothetical protein
LDEGANESEIASGCESNDETVGQNEFDGSRAGGQTNRKQPRRVIRCRSVAIELAFPIVETGDGNTFVTAERRDGE